MSRLIRDVLVVLCASAFIVSISGTAAAQRRGAPRSAPPPHSHVLRGHVFIGGYFYDPFWGPYPWWPRVAYPYWYFPTYDRRAEVHLKVKPNAASVYVDGFYAGVVDDFDGIFQSLPLPPGGHRITLFMEGYRTSEHNVYLGPGSSFTLHNEMERLPAGTRSEPPNVLPPVPPPPQGSYSTPRTPNREPVTPAATPSEAVGYGTLDLRIQPPDADVTLDGQPWVSSGGGRFVVQMPAGMHHVEVAKRGYQTYAADITVAQGDSTPLNVSLMTK
jgi:hypothetical protein